MLSTFQTQLYKHKHKLFLMLIFVCVIYFALIQFAEPDKIFTAFRQIDSLNWILVLSLSLLSYIIRFIRWRYYLRLFHYHVPLKRSLLYYLTGFSLTLTPAKVGETIRSSYLAGDGVPYNITIAMFFTERFLDLVVATLLSTLIFQSSLLAENSSYSSLLIISSIIIVSFIPLLRQRFVSDFIYFIQKSIPWTNIKYALTQVNRLLNSARNLFAITPVYTGLFLGVIVWILHGISFNIILINLNVSIGLISCIAIYTLSLLAGALSFIPGGIGTTEAVMVLLLSLLGVDTSTAIAAALITRLSTLWFAILIGFSSACLLSFYPTVSTKNTGST